MGERREYTGETVRLVDIMSVDGVIEGVTLTDCIINGPVLLLLLDGAVLESNDFSGATFWALPPGASIVYGAVGFRRSVMRRCRLTNIGIVDDGNTRRAFGM